MGFIFGMLLFLSVIPGAAQQQWVELQSPTGRWTQRTLNDVSFIDDGQTGWAAGASGEVLFTNNGGSEWVTQTPGLTANDLHAIQMVDATHGWVAGREGFVGATTDGTNWSPQYSAHEVAFFNLRDISFINEKVGWIVGDCREAQGVKQLNGTLIHTKDGGVTWEQQVAQLLENFNGIHMITEQMGWIVADRGYILHTKDGGTTWTNQTSGIQRHLKDVFFISAARGWCVGAAGNILFTDDGGTTWTKQESGTSLDLEAVMFKDDNTGMVVGARGVVLYTEDAGATWTSENSGVGEGLHGIFFGESVTFVVGDAGLILAQGGNITMVSSFPLGVVPIVTTFLVLSVGAFVVVRNLRKQLTKANH
jgi:photosystem II stability/assembly factor-like uncharacterized protein